MDPSLLAIFFGLASAVSWGAGDFSGGMASKRNSVFIVILLSQIVGAVIIVFLAIHLAEAVPAMSSLLLAGFAGICGVTGLMAFYRGLASGNMSVVAPAAAAVSAALPVLAALFLEGWPSYWQMAGFAVALVAVWLLAQDSTTFRIDFKTLLLPLIAGSGFGLFFIFFGLASTESVFWPLLAARFTSILLLFIVVLLRRRESLPALSQMPLIVLAGLFDTGGNAFFALSAQIGRLDISAVLSSLYPATTVLLAALILKERIEFRQRVGLALAVVAMALIAL